MNRECSTCGRTYFRRNRMELWAVRNEGHRTGWQKVEIKQCMNCQTAPQTRRVLMVAHVTVTKTGNVRASKAASG